MGAISIAPEHEPGEPPLPILGGHDLLVAGPPVRQLERSARVGHPEVEVELVEARLNLDRPRRRAAVDDGLDRLGRLKLARSMTSRRAPQAAPCASMNSWTASPSTRVGSTAIRSRCRTPIRNRALRTSATRVPKASALLKNGRRPAGNPAKNVGNTSIEAAAISDTPMSRITSPATSGGKIGADGRQDARERALHHPGDDRHPEHQRHAPCLDGGERGSEIDRAVDHGTEQPRAHRPDRVRPARRWRPITSMATGVP